jgi:hypothetical protein
MRELSRREIKEITGGTCGGGLLGAIVSFKLGVISCVLNGLFGRGCSPTASQPDPSGGNPEK